jgi:hypothetical protein
MKFIVQIRSCDPDCLASKNAIHLVEFAKNKKNEV